MLIGNDALTARSKKRKQRWEVSAAILRNEGPGSLTQYIRPAGQTDRNRWFFSILCDKPALYDNFPKGIGKNSMWVAIERAARCLAW